MTLVAQQCSHPIVEYQQQDQLNAYLQANAERERRLVEKRKKEEDEERKKRAEEERKKEEEEEERKKVRRSHVMR